MAEGQDPTLRIRGVLDLSDARRELATFSAEGDKGALLVPRAGTAGIPNAGPGGSGVGTAQAVAQAISPRRGGAGAAARDAARIDDLQFQAELAEARTPEFRAQLLGARLDSLDPGSVARARADVAFARAQAKVSGDGPGGGIGAFASSFGARVFAAGALLNTARQFGASVEGERQAGYAANAADNPLSLVAAQRQQAAARYSSPFLRAANFGDSLGGLIEGPRERDLRRLDERARGIEAGNRNFELGQRSDVAEAGFRGLASGGLVGQQREAAKATDQAGVERIQRQISFLEDANRRNPNGVDANRRSNELDQLRRSLEVALEATQKNLRIFDRQQSLAGQAIGVEALDSRDVAAGVLPREQQRRALNRRQALELQRVGLENPGLRGATERAQDADRDAFEATANRQSRFANFANDSATAQARSVINNDPFGGAISGISRRAAADTAQAPEGERASISIRMQTEIAAVVAQTFRSFRSDQQALGTQENVLARQLARDPLGAQLESIRGATNARVIGAESLPFGLRQLAQAGYRGVGRAEQTLATREFNEGIALGDRASGGALESSRLRAEGRGLSATANDVVTSATVRAQELASRGGAFGRQRSDALETGINDLRTLRRQVQFGGFGEEVAPGSIGPAPGTDTRANLETVEQYLSSIDQGIKDLAAQLNPPD